MVGTQHVDVQKLLKRHLVRQAAHIEYGVRPRERGLDGGRPAGGGALLRASGSYGTALGYGIEVNASMRWN